MGLMWFCLGGFLIVCLWCLISWNSRRSAKLSLLGWVSSLITLLAFLFTVAWSVSSVIEGETQAAGAGLVFFGGGTLLLFAVTLRLIKRSN